MTFATNLRRLRLAAGLSQEKLAHACGYPGQSRIANYESDGKNAREPSLDEIPVLAKALGVDIADLFGEANAGAVSQPARLEPAMIAETARSLRKHYERRGITYNIEDDPETFVKAYGWRQELGASSDDLIEYGDRLSELTPQGAAGNGRGESVPNARVAAGKAGRGRGKA